MDINNKNKSRNQWHRKIIIICTTTLWIKGVSITGKILLILIGW